MPPCECCRKHWLVDCPNCGHSMFGYTAEYDADLVAAERARIRAAVEGLAGSRLTFDRKVMKPGRFDGNSYTAPESKITVSVTTAPATDGLIDRAAVLAIIDADA